LYTDVYELMHVSAVIIRPTSATWGPQARYALRQLMVLELWHSLLGISRCAWFCSRHDLCLLLFGAQDSESRLDANISPKHAEEAGAKAVEGAREHPCKTRKVSKVDKVSGKMIKCVTCWCAGVRFGSPVLDPGMRDSSRFLSSEAAWACQEFKSESESCGEKYIHKQMFHTQ